MSSLARAKRVESEVRPLAKIASGYAAIRSLVPLSKWEKSGDKHLNDAAGADYWVYAFGSSVPVEAKSRKLYMKKWESKRNPILLPASAISKEQRGQLGAYDGWLYAVFFIYRDEASRRASFAARYLAPFSVWEEILGEDKGWRRPHLAVLEDMGYYIHPLQFLEAEGKGVVQNASIVEFGEMLGERAIAASARALAFACEHEVFLRRHNDDENGSVPDVCEKALSVLSLAENIVGYNSYASELLKHAKVSLANCGVL